METSTVEGWFRIHRRLMNEPLWTKDPFSRGQAWVDLIGLANHADGFIRVRGNRIDLQRGDVGWSAASLAERWHWSRGKVTRFLEELENDQRIVQQKTFISTVITITNYDLYQQNGQQNEQQTDSRRTADGQQTDTNKKDKKKENGKKEEKRGRFTPPCAAEVTEYAKSIGFDLNGQEFIDHYEANGWMRGKSKVRDWRACVRTWKQRRREEAANATPLFRETVYKCSKCGKQKGASRMHPDPVFCSERICNNCDEK